MKKMLKNSEVFERLHSLKPLLSRRDRIGYIAARNYRFLSNSLVEYETIRLSLIEKYGEEGKDERGQPHLCPQNGVPPISRRSVTSWLPSTR